MRSYEEALNLIVELSRDMDKVEKERKKRVRSDLNKADRAEKSQRLDAQFRGLHEQRMDVLRDLVQFPPYPHYTQYAPLLEGIKVPYELRVFIMTKYRDGANAQLDAQLQKVIDTVKAAVRERGHHPQLAGETKLHYNLWENIECHMLACARGIAIVENRFNPKLNPNIAIEWGWMRAMNKRVLYLVEQAVPSEQVPADLMGLIRSRFDWDNPETDIPRLIAEELPNYNI